MFSYITNIHEIVKKQKLLPLKKVKLNKWFTLIIVKLNG